MKYVCLIYMPDELTLSTEEREYIGAAYQQLNAEASDMIEARSRLHETHAATTLRIRHGKTLLTDGPFAETKEILGGFYLIECADLDAALEFAKRIPSARYGSVEVRPIVEDWTPERESWRF